ncbi:hypothetical protein IE077_000118 [Cardiosporidium cionae]|uniref:Small ribosomal subunit protein mS23 n=1 Tax=Cardiosporidium cionae TaxID=476202 RepID=A0ABQ7JDB5_9APIC|nr:hypothetical protein IE077_000118 [Cardiosporidium cionae]|eukprot:KAF8822007.1 hypothetical protein IE077_000118 [Cardiosporidium cionae]
MAKGAIHPNGTNFRRISKLDIVARMRLLIQQKVYKRPKWLAATEKVPPLELQNLKLKDKTISNPYFGLVKTVLQKYPNLRFQDCFVDGNDWSKGNDTYRDDHPVMQFAAKQLQLMNTGLPKKAAFKQAEKHFYERRLALEKQQKLQMALAVDEKVEPLFTTGQGYWLTQMAKSEQEHLKRILSVLRSMKKNATPSSSDVSKKPSDSATSNFPSLT